MTDTPLPRYERQARFAPLGDTGQLGIQKGRALIAGCGALGSVIANTLARAGVGFLRLVDRDYLEMNNLQRQVLYDEEDVRSGIPKAVAAARKLQKINSEIEIDPIVADINSTNVRSFCDGIDVILDGTDNFEIRFLLNDASIALDIPWIYGGCIGADGQTMTILPGKTACLACLMSDGPPPPGTTATCDSAGILATIINIIASLQANEAIKILSGNRQQINNNMTVVDVWNNRFRSLNLEHLKNRESPCPVCCLRKFEWLDGDRGSQSAVLCGRNAVQLVFPGETHDLDSLERELKNLGDVSRNPFLLRFSIDRFQFTLFPDGRAIISGTDDISIARGLYARYIGN